MAFECSSPLGLTRKPNASWRFSGIRVLRVALAWHRSTLLGSKNLTKTFKSWSVLWGEASCSPPMVSSW
jgi:hypothetical protein